MMRYPARLSILGLFALAACQERPSLPTPKGPTPGDTPAAHDHPKGDRQPLGELSLGGHALRVFQVAPVVAGQEGDFDIEVAGRGALPAAVRGWVGMESGLGSRKVRFEREGARGLHGHPEVPDPLPADARLWLEVEDGGQTEKGSLALRR